MKSINTFYTYLFNLGVEPKASFFEKKLVRFSNQIALLYIVLSLTTLLYFAFNHAVQSDYIFAIFSFGAVLLLVLSHFKRVSWRRIGLSIWPQLFLLVFLYKQTTLNPGISMDFSYIFIGLSIIPLVLFQQKHEVKILYSVLAFNLFVLIIHDFRFTAWGSNSIGIQSFFQDYFLSTMISQLMLGFGIVFGFQYLKKSIIKFEGNVSELIKLKDELQKTADNQYDQVNSLQQELYNKTEIIDNQEHRLANADNELEQTKLAFLKNIENLKEAKNRLIRQEAEAKSVLETLSEHYLVAQYDLNGELVSINKKVIDLLGVVREEQFQNIKPVINRARNQVSKKLNGQYFSYIWDKIVHGEAQTIELDILIGKRSKCLATTFAPLFDENRKPVKILAIGQDITDLMKKNNKVDKINDELKEKISEISQQNELLNFQQLEIFEKSQELRKQKQEIQLINESLELRVQERTSVLEAKNKQLAEYAFINSHVLRAPVSTMMGLINLISYTSLTQEDQRIYEHLIETGKILDNVVHKINTAIEDGYHFNRKHIEPEREFLSMEKK